MATLKSDTLVKAIQHSACPLDGTAGNYDFLMKFIGDASHVLLGEASHGTHEFYRARAEITKLLIREKGFTVIAWEADWPEGLQVNRYIRGGKPGEAIEGLASFRRFPTWMWRNADILDFVGWLQNHNSQLPVKIPKVGVYGLDLYSLHSSMNAVVSYLEKTDPKAAREARERYSCFDHFGDDPQIYGQMTSQHHSLSCEKEVVQQLMELRRHEADFLSRDGRIAADELFFAEQNARVAKNAEHYYRAMYRGRPNTWNLRDTHMVETLEDLMTHLREQGEHPKAVVWAHNSHLGDARATQMSARGELNVGQLIRQRHQGKAVLVGFTTYSGTVTAASEWGGVAERKSVRAGLEDSYEAMFHQVGLSKFLLPIRDNALLARELERPCLERAIGVIYRPETERWSHYFDASLAQQFDAVIHFDETRAVEPLERNVEWETGEFPETYPSGL
jgi:erythromycin esterase-like protein